MWLLNHEVRVELQFSDGLRQRFNMHSYMDEFQKVDAALSFAEVTISDEWKVSFSRSVPPWTRSMRQSKV